MIVLILGFIVAFLAAVYLRIILEVVAVLFAIHDDVKPLRTGPDPQLPLF